ncbi:hypothetical protein [Cellulomonas chitinilytica]|nr:hypothetical protein [Cellulomonas chitinilytica]
MSTIRTSRPKPVSRRTHADRLLDRPTETGPATASEASRSVAAENVRGVSLIVGDERVQEDLCVLINALLASSVPAHVRTNRSLAVDGTAWEVCGGLVAPNCHDDASHAAGKDVGGRQKKEATLPEWRERREPWPPDSRPVFATDPDVRSDHRGSNSRRAPVYVGYELHLAVPRPDAPRSCGLDLEAADARPDTIMWDRGFSRRSIVPMIDGLPFGLFYDARSRVESFSEPSRGKSV